MTVKKRERDSWDVAECCRVSWPLNVVRPELCRPDAATSWHCPAYERETGRNILLERAEQREREGTEGYTSASPKKQQPPATILSI